MRSVTIKVPNVWKHQFGRFLRKNGVYVCIYSGTPSFYPSHQHLLAPATDICPLLLPGSALMRMRLSALSRILHLPSTQYATAISPYQPPRQLTNHHAVAQCTGLILWKPWKTMEEVSAPSRIQEVGAVRVGAFCRGSSWIPKAWICSALSSEIIKDVAASWRGILRARQDS